MMKLCRLFLVIVVLLFPVLAFSQAGTISGTVTGTKGMVAAASIHLRGSKKFTITDTAGYFTLRQVPFGRRVVEVSAAGYQAKLLPVVLQHTDTVVAIALEENMALIDEVVVTAGMRTVSKMASPIPVEVYAHSYFKKNPSPNIFESLQMVNGVQPQLNCNVCNTGDIHINGMEGPYTMILIDGMPIVSSLATVYGLSGIPNSMVKRIEIVKGPASTLYGSEAVGGLVNIITRDAASAEAFRADVSGTSVGEYTADVSAGFKLKNAAALLGVSYFNYQQRRDINNDNFTDIALQHRLSVFNKWSFGTHRSRPASIALRYVTENRWGGEMHWQPVYRGSDKVYGESIQTNRAEMIVNLPFSSKWQADVSYNWHLQDSYYGTVKYHASQQVAFTQLRWGAEYGRHNIIGGIPLRYTYYNDNTPATAGGGGIHSFLPGIFVQDEMKAGKNFLLLGGLRYDYNSDHGSIFTPRIAIKYTPNTQHTIRLSGGSGYRVVNLFTEDHAALTGARSVLIAEALKPEQSWNGNINYSAFVRYGSGFVNFDLSGFYTYFSNKIVADYLTDPQKIIYNNLDGYAISRGITFNADLNFTNRLRINAGATWMDVFTADKTADGKSIFTPQLFAPRFSGTFAISYPFSRAGLLLDFTGRVNGPMHLPVVPDDFRRELSPTYGILNLQLTKTWSNRVEVYTAVKNLLNFIPANPILHADDPFNRPGGKYFDNNGEARPDTNPYGYQFDPSYNYAAVQGAKLLVGVRWQMQ
ncbi:MAG TPA: TonB-dependent receptor [Ferruginibacter sp.]|nr:TonB-dependent receptor [Ferruginibacter sp.]HMP22145.1 TonB-dependent receptor [Ferruginibacter sp.]